MTATVDTSDAAVLTADGLVREFRLAREGFGARPLLRAVDDVSISLSQRRTLGIVGESGCGKSTLGRLLIGLIPASEGTVTFRGTDITSRGQRAEMRGRLQMVFQDPHSSMDPRMSVRKNVGTSLIGRQGASGQGRINDYLERVGLSAEIADRYPHELSGGQQQRAAIARALLSNPEVVVLDEAVSSLDVSLRAQILNLLLDLQQDLGVSYVFISHDLRAVEAVSDEVAVMYLGQIVEKAPTDMLMSNTLHPYSMALRSAALVPDPAGQRATPRILLRGDIPSAVDRPQGCRFASRCPIAQEICHTTPPPLAEQRPQHWVACHFAETSPALMKQKISAPRQVGAS